MQSVRIILLSLNYYYSLSNNHKEGEYGRFNLSPKMKAILNSSEGFFVDSGGCRKYFKYGWDYWKSKTGVEKN